MKCSNSCSRDTKLTFQFLWMYEVTSVLAKAQRLGSITAEKSHEFLEDMRSLDITIDDEGLAHIFDDVRNLAFDHALSGYDAAYLELAMRKGIPLATLDDELRKAAASAKVSLFEPLDES